MKIQISVYKPGDLLQSNKTLNLPIQNFALHHEWALQDAWDEISRELEKEHSKKKGADAPPRTYIKGYFERERGDFAYGREQEFKGTCCFGEIIDTLMGDFSRKDVDAVFKIVQDAVVKHITGALPKQEEKAETTPDNANDGDSPAANDESQGGS